MTSYADSVQHSIQIFDRAYMYVALQMSQMSGVSRVNSSPVSGVSGVTSSPVSDVSGVNSSPVSGVSGVNSSPVLLPTTSPILFGVF